MSRLLKVSGVSIWGTGHCFSICRLRFLLPGDGPKQNKQTWPENTKYRQEQAGDRFWAFRRQAAAFFSLLSICILLRFQGNLFDHLFACFDQGHNWPRGGLWHLLGIKWFGCQPPVGDLVGHCNHHVACSSENHSRPNSLPTTTLPLPFPLFATHPPSF